MQLDSIINPFRLNSRIMYKFLITLFLLLPFVVFCQKYSLDNNIGLNYSGTNKSLNGSAILQNSVNLKRTTFSDNIDFGFSNSSGKNSISILNKLACSWERTRFSWFATVQNNYSTGSTRILNLGGIGIGRKDTLVGTQLKYSYGILCQYIGGYNQTYLRHSARVKIFRSFNKFSVSTEIFYQPIIVNPRDYIIYFSGKIAYVVGGGLSVSLSGVDNYYSGEQIPRVQILNFGLSYILSI